MKYQLKCLLCGATDSNLVHIQEHAMNEHGYTQDDHRKVTKRATDEGYIYTFPDGKDWLEATVVGGNTVGGL